MGTRIKLIGAGILLCLAVGLTVFFAVQTVHAVQRFEQSRYMAQSGDISTIRPWMTLPFISRVYHVPESYLLDDLHISDAHSVRHTTLYALAVRMHRSPTALVQQIQSAILTYRAQRRPQSPPATHTTTIPPPPRRAPA
jgi:hypothetical protein